ncbi:MAG: glucoamylase family protein [Phycisphaerales bacterium JB047]
MKTITQPQYTALTIAASTLGLIGCANQTPNQDHNPMRVDATSITIQSPPQTPRPPFNFNQQEQRFLDETQEATFRYFMQAVAPETGMVYDRTSSDVISIAGVGFQLAALPIGVERGWITRQQGAQRARLIIKSLKQEPSNRKAGLFYHFINPHDASARRVGRELVVSTVDSALLFSGMIVAAQYFQGDILTDTNTLLEQADWSFFAADPGDDAPEGTFLSLGWKPSSDAKPTAEGELLPYYWLDCGDEHRLTTFLAACATNPDHRVPTSMYWALRRQLGYHQDQGHIVWFPYSGALFTSFFAHLFIDYNTLATDHPSAHNQHHRASVDWWENSRRTVNLHRDRAIQNPLQLPTLAPDAWGFSASDGPEGYVVSGQYPQPVEMLGAQPNRDFATYQPNTDWGDGIIAPYAAGTSIMFEPQLAIQALKRAKSASATDARLSVWNPPNHQPWGFVDAFRLDHAGQLDWVAEDFVAISQGPLILGIENARTGLIWELFMAHPMIQAGSERLGLTQEHQP